MSINRDFCIGLIIILSIGSALFAPKLFEKDATKHDPHAVPASATFSR